MNDDNLTNPVKGVGAFSTEHAAAALVVGSLLFLILVRRGFRGVSFGGASVSVS
jgi:hypothetical protein